MLVEEDTQWLKQVFEHLSQKTFIRISCTFCIKHSEILLTLLRGMTDTIILAKIRTASKPRLLWQIYIRCFVYSLNSHFKQPYSSYGLIKCTLARLQKSHAIETKHIKRNKKRMFCLESAYANIFGSHYRQNIL